MTYVPYTSAIPHCYNGWCGDFPYYHVIHWEHYFILNSLHYGYVWCTCHVVMVIVLTKSTAMNDALFCLIDVPSQSSATQHIVNDDDDDILSGFVVVDNEQCTSEGNNRMCICCSNTRSINLLPNF